MFPVFWHQITLYNETKQRITKQSNGNINDKLDTRLSVATQHAIYKYKTTLKRQNAN